MTAKEYLSQARYLDMRINTKIQQLESLNSLATKCTSVCSDMPRSSTINGSSLENTICKIVDLQHEINTEIDELVDLKIKIAGVIKAVTDEEYRLLLEKRYINMLTWEQIAADMNYDIRWIHKKHNKALKMVKLL